jgi:hypothetical protein
MRQRIAGLYQMINLSIDFSDLLINSSQAGFALTASDGQGFVFVRLMTLLRSLINPERNERNSFRSYCIFAALSSGSNAKAFLITASILASMASVFALTPCA